MSMRAKLNIPADEFTEIYTNANLGPQVTEQLHAVYEWASTFLAFVGLRPIG